jgi:hypothetical protein
MAERRLWVHFRVLPVRADCVWRGKTTTRCSRCSSEIDAFAL